MTGIGEILFIVSVAIVVLGYRHLPKIGGYLSNSIKGFRKGLKDDERKIRDVTPPKD